MKIKRILFTLLILSLIIISGCNGKIAYSEDKLDISEEEQLPIQTLGSIWVSAKNWDADAEIDGLEFDLEPKDMENKIVPTKGTLKAKLWEYICLEHSEFSDYCLEEECDKNNPTADTWTIQLNKENFDVIFGATVRLEYQNYIFTDDRNLGCIEIVFTTEEGKSFTVNEEDIYLNGF